MAYTTVVTHATGDVFPAADWNTYVRDNLAYLHGDAGAIALNNSIGVGGASAAIGAAAGAVLAAAGGINAASNAVANAILTGTVVGDATDYRFTLGGDGKMQWGSGAAVRDTTLARIAVGELALGSTTQGNALRIFQSATGNMLLRGFIAAEANPRFSLQGDGTISWGPGAGSATDTVAARAGVAGVLGVTNKLVETYGTTTGGAATWTPTYSGGLVQRYNMNVVGTLTIASPGAPPANTSCFLVLVVHNATAGSLTLAWNAIYSGSPQTTVTTGAPTLTCLLVYNPGEAKWNLLTSNAV